MYVSNTLLDLMKWFPRSMWIFYVPTIIRNKICNIDILEFILSETSLVKMPYFSYERLRMCEEDIDTHPEYSWDWEQVAMYMKFSAEFIYKAVMKF